MSLSKQLFIIILLSLTMNAFACRPSSQMSGSLMPISSILNTLSETKRFNNYSFKSLNFLSNKYIYRAILKNENTNSCLAVLITPISNGMCKFKAQINKVTEVTCK
jgi:uncharacterized secreted protein with C-terminal beta-propeller domain